MPAWYAIDPDLEEHPRFLQFLRYSNLTTERGLLALHRIWSLARRKFPSGTITGHNALTLEDAIRIPGVVAQMVQAGFLVNHDEGFVVRDWMERNGQFIRQRFIQREISLDQRTRAGVARAGSAKRLSNGRFTSATPAGVQRNPARAVSIEHRAVSIEPSSDSEMKLNGREADRVSAAALARCKERFPNLDLPVIEAKLLAHHATHPYKRLDRAIVNWCLKAEKNGWDTKPDPIEPTDSWSRYR